MNKNSKTNLKRIDSLTDEKIDTSDIPPLGKDFFAKAEVHIAGQGIYTEERRALYQDRTVDDLVAEIEKDRLHIQAGDSR